LSAPIKRVTNAPVLERCYTVEGTPPPCCVAAAAVARHARFTAEGSTSVAWKPLLRSYAVVADDRPGCRYKAGTSSPLDSVMDLLTDKFALAEVAGSIICTNAAFSDGDPLPNVKKQCYCVKDSCTPLATINPICSTVAQTSACEATSTNPLLAITPAASHRLGWDGSNGLYRDIGPTKLCNNVALAACPFNSSSLGDENNYKYHYGPAINDGSYGNADSWIPGPADPDPFVVLKFDRPVELSAIAFGRDNSHSYADRSVGTYTIAYATTAFVGANFPSFIDVGTITTRAAPSSALATDQPFMPSRRHQYSLAKEEGNVCTNIVATAIRVSVTQGMCIDELEVFGMYSDEA